MISPDKLKELYVLRGQSMQNIASSLDCSVHTVQYWMEKYKIQRRSISDAIYLKSNPYGDPFSFHEPSSRKEAQLYGTGIGLYWGEGTKANLDSVRLGNTDPRLVAVFIEFLERFFGVRRGKMRFGLQIFSDIDLGKAMDFWMKKLKIKPSQFYKPVVSLSGSVGTYKHKSKYGVLTVMYHNKRLRNLLIEKLADVAQW